MTTGRCARTVRAGMFAAVCTVLAAVGHVIMSGAPVPWWALLCSLAVAVGVGWALAASERGRRAVLAGCVGLQITLHCVLCLAQAIVHPTAGLTPVRRWVSYLLCDALPAPGSGHDPPPSTHSMPMPAIPGMGTGTGSTHAMPGMEMAGHDMSGVSSAGMPAAHLLAAVVCGLWLARGEQVAFDALRAVEGWLTAPLRLPPLALVPVPDLLIPFLRPATDWAPRMLLLSWAITSRGPPGRLAVA